MKEGEKKRRNIAVIGFLYTPAVIIFCADKPIFIAKDEKDIFTVLNNIDPKRKGKIYFIDYPFATHLFETEWWCKLKSDYLNMGKDTNEELDEFSRKLLNIEVEQKLKKLEEIEYFLFNCEKGIWN